MECRSLGRGRQLRTEAGRQLVGSEGGTCHFRFGNQICMLSILKSLTVSCFNLLGMRSCSLGKINLAICISICKIGLLFASLPRLAF